MTDPTPFSAPVATSTVEATSPTVVMNNSRWPGWPNQQMNTMSTASRAEQQPLFRLPPVRDEALIAAIVGSSEYLHRTITSIGFVTTSDR